MITIAEKEYKIARTLGKGTFSRVYEGKYEGKEFPNIAVKIYRDTDELSSVCSICREISILKLFQNEIGIKHNIIQLIDVICDEIVDPPYVAIGLPKYDRTLFIACINGMLTFSDKIRIMAKIIDSVVFLHDNEIMHRDIKPDNVMITSDKNPVLIDFTISKWFSDKMPEDSHTSVVVSAPYRAPEVIQRNPYDFRIDIYACGVMFFEMFSGLYALSEDEHECLGKVQYSLYNTKNVPYIRMFQRMTSINPENRISLRRMYKHIWKSWLRVDKVWNQELGNKPQKISNYVYSDISVRAIEIYMEKTGCTDGDAVTTALYLFDNVVLTDNIHPCVFRMLKKLKYNIYI